MLGFNVADITLFTNIVLITIEIVTLGYIAKWYLEPHANGELNPLDEVLWSWTLVSIGYFIRIGYWVLAIATNDPVPYKKCNMNLTECVTKFESYPQWALDNRGWLIISAILVSWGALKFIRHIEGFSFQTKLGILSTIIVIATLPVIFIS
jgi:hypothetical protein